MSAPLHDRPRLRPLAFVAPSGTGKTTLLEATVALLVARGLSIAVLKASHHDHDLDSEGKDSWRMQRAGADFVGLCGPSRTTFFVKSGREAWPPVAEVAAWLALAPFVRYDLVLCEGFSSDASAAKLRVVRGAWPEEVAAPEDLVAVAWDGFPGSAAATALPAGVAKLALDAASVATWIEAEWLRP